MRQKKSNTVPPEYVELSRTDREVHYLRRDGSILTLPVLVGDPKTLTAPLPAREGEATFTPNWWHPVSQAGSALTTTPNPAVMP